MNSELQTLFNQAVEAQSQSKDIEALELYKTLNQKGFTSVATELNKATLYDKQGEWGRALKAVEEAQFLARNPWLASEKKEHIQKRVASNRSYAIGSTGELTQEISKMIRPEESLFLGTLLLGAFLIGRGLGFKHRGFYMSALTSIFFFVFFALATFSNKTAYVISDAELKKLPVVGSSSRFTVGKGSKVKILATSDTFAKIERPGDFEGWISKSALEP